MRSDEENACSLRGLEGNHDSERASRVLHAEPAQRNRAGQPLGAAQPLIDRSSRNAVKARVCPVQGLYLLLRAPRRDDFHWRA